MSRAQIWTMWGILCYKTIYQMNLQLQYKQSLYFGSIFQLISIDNLLIVSNFLLFLRVAKNEGIIFYIPGQNCQNNILITCLKPNSSNLLDYLNFSARALQIPARLQMASILCFSLLKGEIQSMVHSIKRIKSYLMGQL